MTYNKPEYMINKFQKIENAFKKCEEYKDSDISQELNSYLVVLISGIYEDVIENLFIERAGKTKDSEIKSFMSNYLDKGFRNPNYENILKLLAMLNPDYKKSLKNKKNTHNIPEYNTTGLDSIITNKNEFAHGYDNKASFDDIKNYHKRAVKIFEVLEKILLNTL